MSKSITDIVITQGPSNMLSEDTNNCTVLALSATLGVSYDIAHKMAEDNWKRPHKKGARLSSLINYFKDINTPEVDTVNVYHTKWNNKDVKNDPEFYAELVNDLMYHWVYGTRETQLMIMAKNNLLIGNK